MMNTFLEECIHFGRFLVSFLPMHTCMGNLSWICLATRELLAALQNCSLMRLDQSQSKDHEPPTCLVANLHSSFPLHLFPFFCFPASRHYVNIRGKHVLPSLCVHSKRYINALTVFNFPFLSTLSVLCIKYHMTILVFYCSQQRYFIVWPLLLYRQKTIKV